MGVAPLWLRLLDFGTFKAPQSLPLTAAVWIERYGAKAWERWAVDHLGGRLWFMDAGAGRLWRGQFVVAHRQRERAAMAAAAGEARARAADWTQVSRWVDLALDGPFDPAAMKLRRGAALGPDGMARRFAWFVPAGDEAERPPFDATIRPRFQKEARGDSRRLEVRVDGRWLAGSPERR
jgi:hypothetical protein